MADLPEIIEAGSKSPLAILALCICILAILALSFFRGATERTRVIIFLVILLSFAGALGIAYADWRNRAVPAEKKDSIGPARRAPDDGHEDAYQSSEQRVMREARLTGSMNTIERSVRPGEWNMIDTVSDYDPQGCGTTAMSVRLANRPLNGEFRTEPTTVSYGVEEECRTVSGPATAIYYRPKPGYWGKDIFSYITPGLDRTTIVRTKGEGSQ